MKARLVTALCVMGACAAACGDSEDLFSDGTGGGGGADTGTATPTGTGTATSTATGTSTATFTGTGTTTFTGTGTATFTGTGTATSTGTGTATGTATGTSTGTGTGTPTGTGTGTGTIVGCGDLLFSEPNCDICMNASCCGQMAACATGTACDQVLQCILFTCDGTDPSCESACKNANVAGGIAYDAMSACANTSCPACASSFCGTAIGFQSGVLNACVSANCCATANPCVADPTCQSCLLSVSPPPSCASNPLLTSFEACLDTSCPNDICGSGIGYFDGQDPAIECNLCGSTSCCADMLACADPSNDGNTGVGDVEVEACLDCLAGAPSCVGGAVAAAAAAFDACLTASCSAQCN